MSSRTHLDRRIEQAIHRPTPDATDGHGSLVYVAGAPLDLTVVPSGLANGAKHPARIEVGLGGVGGNGSPVLLINGIRCHLISPQGQGPLGELCRSLAIKKGLIPHLIPRPEEDPAISVSVPSGPRLGARDLYIQRLGPPRPCELVPLADVIGAADALIVGPMPIAGGVEGEETIAMLCGLADMAPDGYRALTPHPSLITHADFARVARRFSFIQMNGAEASLVSPSSCNLLVLADRWLELLGENHELAITNGDQVGRLWADGRWWPIVPAPVETTSDVGAGDTFGTAWVVARRFFRCGVPEALDYALRAAASFLAEGRAIPYQVHVDAMLAAG
jgi:sugar/nucleoside kinase (ribokinase family)